jgi:hypothetical protein
MADPVTSVPTSIDNRLGLKYLEIKILESELCSAESPWGYRNGCNLVRPSQSR